MATTECAAELRTRDRTAFAVLLGIAILGVVGVGIYFINRPPQMGADEDVFRTVDALYTAVRMRDETKVNQCAERLHDYREAGKLPASSAKFLDHVIAKSRAGQWEDATEQLYTFMRAQHREGADAPTAEKHYNSRSGKKASPR